MTKYHLPKKPLYRTLLKGMSSSSKDHDSSFYDIFKRFERRFSNVFLLESLGEQSFTSRYSVIGFDPAYLIKCQDRKVEVVDTCARSSERFEPENPYYFLKSIFPWDVISRGYAGGLVGYLSYECISFFEPSVKSTPHSDFGRFCFGVYLDGLIFDKMTGEMTYFTLGKDRFQLCEDTINATIDEIDPPKIHFQGDLLSAETHQTQVIRCKEEIKAGRVFQVEVGMKSFYEVAAEADSFPATAVYNSLRSENPSPHMYYLKFDNNVLLGASPELLLRLRQGELETFPLAGTTRRGKTPEEDLDLARKLLNDQKEIAEHAMLVDLHRNDLGRVAEYGTVKVRSLMDIKRFSHVQHISSEVVGILKSDEDMFSALASVFPAGTLSGAPKIEAMKLISELETAPRGPYGGAVGHFGFNGDCTFAIPIRSLFVSGKTAYAQTSGGIVYDSEPAHEYQEIQLKLGAMKAVCSKLLK